MNQTITSTVEDASLTCTDSLGWTVKYGPGIAPGKSAAECPIGRNA
jgi:hypothetical protein